MEVVKLLKTTDTQQYEHELIKRRVNSDKKKMPDIMKNDTNITDETTPDIPIPGFGLSHEFNKSSMHNASNTEDSSGFGIFIGVFILSIAVFWCKKD